MQLKLTTWFNRLTPSCGMLWTCWQDPFLKGGESLPQWIQLQLYLVKKIRQLFALCTLLLSTGALSHYTHSRHSGQSARLLPSAEDTEPIGSMCILWHPLSLYLTQRPIKANWRNWIQLGPTRVHCCFSKQYWLHAQLRPCVFRKAKQQHGTTVQAVGQVGEHQHQLAHWCSKFHTDVKLKHNGRWGCGIRN